MDKPNVLVIVGPTASGKSALAVAMAKQHNGEIISADSRTIYKGMDIGTAKPTQEEQQGVPHFGFDLVTPDKTFSVKEFQDYAIQKIEEIRKRGHLPIIVGGTGLYVSSIVDSYPFTDIVVDDLLRESLEKRTLESLLEELQIKDPKSAAKVDVKNKRRVQRALEFFLQTGKSFADQHQTQDSPYTFLIIGIKKTKDEVHTAIDRRVEQMCTQGLEKEVKALVDTYGWEAPGMQAIAYQEWNGYFEGKKKLTQVKEEIKKDNKQYAKRQMTWFKRDKRIHWFEKAQEAQAFMQTE